MRWAAVFIVIATLVFAFLFVDRFPQLLDEYPTLQRMNWQLRDLLGLEIPSSAYLPDHKLTGTDELLREESEMEAITSVCGSPPENPWSRSTAPTEGDIERYEMAVKIWEYCRNQVRSGNAPSYRKRTTLTEYQE